jgi:hypothetical protein
MFNGLYAKNDSFRSFLGFGSKIQAKVHPHCAEYLVKYQYSSITLGHFRTCHIKRIPERYHLSRLSHFWWSYGDFTVVSVGVWNGLFDISPYKWLKTCTTTHAADVKHQDTSNGGSVDSLGSFLTEL